MKELKTSLVVLFTNDKAAFYMIETSVMKQLSTPLVVLFRDRTNDKIEQKKY